MNTLAFRYYSRNSHPTDAGWERHLADLRNLQKASERVGDSWLSLMLAMLYAEHTSVELQHQIEQAEAVLST